ncbi:hypothetical protein DAPPUDRAFT_259701 [Daphnia pulex]|uniref:Uncharacterized protein n=1 Tax=Daphnia pulex TaxID=6669 RepID=E9HHP4_DAPPU|nr:hypothetical protein DAPPUDRAFT_259701 [Daphnia pulex]|eukprot:EFX68757.1 hypothetical protein DAPPUDRAFT_259701 [Daphnia pulex]
MNFCAIISNLNRRVTQKIFEATKESIRLDQSPTSRNHPSAPSLHHPGQDSPMKLGIRNVPAPYRAGDRPQGQQVFMQKLQEFMAG